ncbi:O-methyltransferase [Alkalihalobacillus oceani]|uniref:O-methyltransferase n=1 Tax=Halalkalibacter oceani TaxID=1653776 RepID=UPI00203D12C0|nr:O-methyltransferase [Halalkalibacter oceani]MCM3762315.1 O-methyltransferase [Halalkalibacter oceani]
MIEKELAYYLHSLLPARPDKIVEMERFAGEHEVPIMDLIGMECLLQQLKLIKPKRILEIGTAIGYSAGRMALALPEATIVTIERDAERYEQALANIQALKLTDRIDVWHGDALELSQKLEFESLFDVLFIDAAKGQYQRFFEMYGSYVKEGGVVFSDNVLFRGLVATDHIENKRLRQLTNKIKTYNSWLMSQPDYETTIIPVGDGLAVSVKKGRPGRG